MISTGTITASSNEFSSLVSTAINAPIVVIGGGESIFGSFSLSIIHVFTLLSLTTEPITTSGNTTTVNGHSSLTSSVVIIAPVVVVGGVIFFVIFTLILILLLRIAYKKGKNISNFILLRLTRRLLGQGKVNATTRKQVCS